MRYRNSEFQNRNSNFLTLQTSGLKKYFPTRIFGIKNRIGIPLTMGVPEIGTKNRNSQPSETVAEAAAMLALLNIGRGHNQQATEARGEGENEGGRGQQQ